MNYINENLKKLCEIARNPNLNGGVWNSFYLFISVSDELLRNRGIIENTNSKEEFNEIIKNLESIREKFKSVFGFELEKTAWYGQKFESLKNSKFDAHKFRKKLFLFMRSYMDCFL